MFKVVKSKLSNTPEPAPIKVNEYVKENRLPDTTEYFVRNRLKERREELGLTKSCVAEMLNITRQSYSLIEKGKQTPSILTSWLIAKVLTKDISELFYFEEVEGDDENEKRE